MSGSIQKQRMMAKRGFHKLLFAKQLRQIQLRRRGRQQIRTTHNEVGAMQQIIRQRGNLVGRNAVFAPDYKIAYQFGHP